MRRVVTIAFAAALGVGWPSVFGIRSVAQVSAASASVAVTQQGFTVVGDAAWRVVVDIGDATNDSLNLDVVSHRRVNTRGELADVVAGRLPDELDRMRFAVSDLARNSTGRLVVSVPTATNTSAPENLLFGTSGVYPVSIELRDGEALLGSTFTFVHRLEPDDAVSATIEGTLKVMNVAALSSAPARTANGENVVSPQFSAQLANLVDAYGEETSGAFVSLQADQAAVAGAGAFAALRKEAGRHTFAATPFVPLNPGAMAEAGLGELYASQMRAGEDAIASAIGSTPDRGVIVVDDRLNANGAVLLRDVGVRGAILTPRAVDASGFRGRVDSQVKFRGYRIELGEIETVARRTFGLKTVAVVVSGEGAQARLVLFHLTGEATEAVDLQRLGTDLPTYMVPAEAVALDAMPTNQNGKIDRRALASRAHGD